MAEDRAVIEAELRGAGKVAAESKKIGKSLTDAKREGEGVGKAAKGSAAEVKSLGDRVDGLKTAISPRTLLGASIGGMVVSSIGAALSYLKEGATQARQFGDATAGTARRASLDLSGLRAQVQANELATLQGADSQLAFVDAVQDQVGAGRQAAGELAKLSALSTALGRDITQLTGTWVALRDGANVEDVTGEMGRLYEQARRLNTVGGPERFLKSIEGLRPVFEQVSMDSAGAERRLTSLVALASRKMRPEQAASMVSGAVGAIQSRAWDIQRRTGEDPRDENGFLRDPVATMRKLKALALKDNRGDKRLAAEGLGQLIGPQAARFIFSDDFDRVDDESKRREEADIKAGIKSVFETPEAQRQRIEMVEKQRKLAAGNVTLATTDSLKQSKEEAYRVAAESVSMPTAQAPDPVRERLAGAGIAPGGGGPVMVELNTSQIRDIGAATADALRQQPPQIRFPMLPNADKVQ